MRGLAFGALLLALAPGAAAGEAEAWRWEWPRTDFSRHAVELAEIASGGPPRDGIPAIDEPRFVWTAQADHLADGEPVIALELGGEVRAYPLQVLHWHEIVNDVVGGIPVAVTYCPLCNAAVVFDRRLGSRLLDFGTTGKLRHSDLVMYDRQTESWWQQFSGEAIVGALTGERLEMAPARIESFARFRDRGPMGRVLVPSDPGLRPYGANPYPGYDSAEAPFLFAGPLPQDVPAMARVVAVGDRAWTLELLRREGAIETDGLRLEWQAGQASALDDFLVSRGRDVGNVAVRRRTAGGGWADAVHGVTFAFVFHAFNPEGVIHTLEGPLPGGRRPRLAEDVD